MCTTTMPMDAARPTASVSRASAAREAWPRSGFSQGRMTAARVGRPPAQLPASAVSISRAGSDSGAVPSALAASNSWIGAPGITVLIACL